MSDHVFGWRQTHGRPDQYHGLCPGDYVSQFGVAHHCSCPGHESAQSPLVDSETHAPMCDNGATTKAAPGGASTPESQGLADYRESTDE